MAAQLPSSTVANLTQPAQGNLQGMYSFQVTQSFTIVNTITTSTQNLLLTGLQVGDLVVCSKTTAQTGLIFGGIGVCVVAGQVPVTFANPTAGNITPTASDTYQGVVFRPLGGTSAYLAALPLQNEFGQT
jgi:hypothetical protein